MLSEWYLRGYRREAWELNRGSWCHRWNFPRQVSDSPPRPVENNQFYLVHKELTKVGEIAKALVTNSVAEQLNSVLSCVHRCSTCWNWCTGRYSGVRVIVRIFSAVCRTVIAHQWVFNWIDGYSPKTITTVKLYKMTWCLSVSSICGLYLTSPIPKSTAENKYWEALERIQNGWTIYINVNEPGFRISNLTVVLEAGKSNPKCCIRPQKYPELCNEINLAEKKKDCVNIRKNI